VASMKMMVLLETKHFLHSITLFNGDGTPEPYKKNL